MYLARIDCMRGLTCLTLLFFMVLLSACGGGGSSSGSTTNAGDTPTNNTPPTDTPSASSDSIDTVLKNFGINTDPSPRVDDNGSALPDDYSPLGTTRKVSRFEEIQLFGVPLDSTNRPPDPNGQFSGGRMPSIDVNLSGTSFVGALLYDTPASVTPWFDVDARGAAAGDIDGDGLDETVIAWQEDQDQPVYLTVLQEGANGSASEAIVVATGTAADRLTLATGDFNGDTQIDVAVAIAEPGGSVELIWLTNASGVLSLSGNTESLPNSQYSYAWVSMASGNLDQDAGHELGIVVSEFGGDIGVQTGSNITEGAAFHWIFDDLQNNQATLRSGRVVIDDSTGPVAAKAADISFGDVDLDNVDELVLGGLDNIGRRGGSSPNSQYLVGVYDDARSGFAPMATSVFAPDLPRSGSASDTQYLYYLFVETGDIDGDGAAEIVTNQYIFDDQASTPGTLVQLRDEVQSAQEDAEINAVIDSLIFFSDDQRAFYLSPTHMDMAVGAVAANDRDDILLYVQRRNTQSRKQDFTILGLSENLGFIEYDSMEAEFAPPGDAWYPTILLPDLEINGDTASLRLSGGSYRYLLTEPIILAALAAAPCATDLGQDLSSCRTGYGTRNIDGQTSTSGVGAIVNVSVGYDGTSPAGGGVSAVNVRNEWKRYTTDAYRTEISVTRETGPIEDTVIFTTVPYDIWTYEILSHPQSDLIGDSIEVRLPREPLLLMTTREIYNSTTDSEAVKVDEAVFGHTPGDPGSYPSPADKTVLLNRWPGVESPGTRVGLNTGRQTVLIENFTETTRGESYSFRATFTARTSIGGFFIEGEVGAGFDTDITTTRGEGTIYLGQVAEIGPDQPIGKSYEYGLFAYFYDPPGVAPPFEVLNYWVDDFE